MRFVSSPSRAIGSTWALAIVAGAAVPCFHSAASAQNVTIIVEDINGQPLAVNSVSAGSDYLMTVPAAARRIVINTGLPSDDIGRLIFLGGPASNPVDISLGADFGPSSVPAAPVGRSWRGIDASDLFHSRFYGGIAGDLTGSIIVDELVRFNCGGAITAPVASPSSASGCAIVAREVRSGVVLSIPTGNVTELRTTGGPMAGTLNIANGSLGACIVAGDLIGKINVPFGSIGSIAVSGAIDTHVPPGELWPIRARNGIDSIVASRIDAKITTAADGGLGTLGLLKATSGPFAGALYTRGVTPAPGLFESGIRVSGDVTASLDIRDQDLRAPLRIGGSLIGPLSISDPDGLRAQVIIGAVGTGVPTWATDVVIGGVALTTKPYYTRLPSTMGFGAVGHAPFNLHFEDCTPFGARPPANPTTCGFFITAIGPTVTPSVTLRHYGPVTFSSGVGIGVRVNSRAAGVCAWTDVTTQFATVLNPDGESRAVRVQGAQGQPGFVGGPGYDVEYLITPVITGIVNRRLMCADVDGNPPVRDYKYLLRVAAAPVSPPPPPPPPPTTGTTTTRNNPNHRKVPVLSDNQN